MLNAAATAFAAALYYCWNIVTCWFWLWLLSLLFCQRVFFRCFVELTQLNRRAWNLVTNLIMNKPCTRSMFADKIEPGRYEATKKKRLESRLETESLAQIQWNLNLKTPKKDNDDVVFTMTKKWIECERRSLYFRPKNYHLQNNNSISSYNYNNYYIRKETKQHVIIKQ